MPWEKVPSVISSRRSFSLLIGSLKLLQGRTVYRPAETRIHMLTSRAVGGRPWLYLGPCRE